MEGIPIRKVEERVYPGEIPTRLIRFLVGEEQVSYSIPLGNCSEEHAADVARKLYLRDRADGII